MLDTLSMKSVVLAVAVLWISTSTVASPRYSEIRHYLSENNTSKLTQWDQIESRLVQQFDDICGDTFCEGKFSDYFSLDLRCSVENATQIVKNCLWSFAATETYLDPLSGLYETQSQAFSCVIQLNINVDDVISSLSSRSSFILDTELPQGVPSFYQQLIDCL